MNRKNFGWVFALCLLATANAGADDRDDDDRDDNMRSCIAREIDDCADDCRTARCVSKCEKEAREKCKVNVIVAQHVFNGAVTSTPIQQECFDGRLACFNPNAVPPGPCSEIKGTVANRAFFGGPVRIFVICPPGSPAGTQNFATTTTVLGQTCSNPADGSFTMTVSNQCSGQSGCYALISAAPATTFDCLTDAPTDSTTTGGGDPGWDTCTSGACPDI